MFQVAIDAGHYRNTAGKRIPKNLDKNQTREWVLNNRLAQYLAKALENYEGVTCLRTDDPLGAVSTGLQARCDRANNWGADFFLSIHHNAGIGGGSGGGIVAYSYKKSKKNSNTYRDAIYDACIRAGGLKGNRSKPKNTASYHVLKYTKMPAVLMEYGFMDSKTDAPVILKDSYAKAMAEATAEAIAKVAGLQKKTPKVSLQLPLLQKGVKCEGVRAMQILLIGKGFSCGEKGADGSFGEDTRKGVTAYQTSQKIYPDGICGQTTWGNLLGV